MTTKFASSQTTPKIYENQDLVRDAMNGNVEAFGQLVRQYQDRLYSSVVYQIGCPIEAEDVVQEAFLTAFKKLSTFRSKSSFYTWLYRIALNLAHSRTRRRRRNVFSEANHEGTLPDPELVEVAPEQKLIDEEQRAQLQEAIRRLPSQSRSILILREFEDLDYEAISQRLHVPLGTVRSRLSRARAQLKAQFDWMNEPGMARD